MVRTYAELFSISTSINTQATILVYTYTWTYFSWINKARKYIHNYVYSVTESPHDHVHIYEGNRSVETTLSL